jgi:hypothetical protein
MTWSKHITEILQANMIAVDSLITHESRSIKMTPLFTTKGAFIDPLISENDSVLLSRRPMASSFAISWNINTAHFHGGHPD